MALAAVVCAAGELEEYKVKRKEVFEFAEKPRVTAEGDKVTIRFACKDYCDATVAIENAEGRIVRHLASGVLGPNAPEPLQKNALQQTLVWDSKDDQEKYVEDRASLSVRVSLGLRPRFEKTLFHSPYKRFGRNLPSIAAAPEGVYVYEGDIADSVRFFDHAGNYARAVYPFPNGRLEQVKGLRWHAAPQDGARMPLKDGYHQATFFTSGYNGGFDEKTGFGLNRFLTLKHFDGSPSYPAATAFAVSGQRIALAGVFLNRMATDGGSGGLELSGPKTSLPALNAHYCNGTTPIEAFPRSAALSPDGKWLYLTGYTWDEGGSTAGQAQRWIHGVARVAVEGDGKTELWVGNAKWGNADAGNGPDRLNAPMSVACDAQGRVYVADYGNNRIQVFAPDGKLQESIPANRPAHAAVHQRTGEIFVFSWAVLCDATDGKPETVEPVLTRLEGSANRKKIAEYKLPLNQYINRCVRAYAPSPGIQYRVELDSWAEPPTVWLVPGGPGPHTSWKQAGIRVLALEGDKLTVKKDFGEEARKVLECDWPSGTQRQRLSVNPKTGKLYVMDGMGLATGDRVVEIDPQSGKDCFVDLPFGAEDLCFDSQGLAYLRTGDLVVRYDPSSSWREVPWDYGEEREGIQHCGGRAGKAISAMTLPGHRASPWYHGGGFGVSPRGHLVAQCWNAAQFAPKRDRQQEKVKSEGAERYTPPLYPGRQRWGEIHVWDKHGKLLYRDAVPGITITDGVNIDKDDNLYVLANPTRLSSGGGKVNPKTETLIKVKPGRGTIVTSGSGGEVPVPLGPGKGPDAPPQIGGFYLAPAWVQGAEWLYGGVGYAGGRCTCHNARCALDYFARSFAPEPDRFSVAVLDTAGNVMVRVGRPGNVEDGQALAPDAALPASRSIGGDETAILHACYVAVETDRRLYLSDAGNRRIACVKLGYHSEERIALKDAAK